MLPLLAHYPADTYTVHGLHTYLNNCMKREFIRSTASKSSIHYNKIKLELKNSYTLNSAYVEFAFKSNNL